VCHVQVIDPKSPCFQDGKPFHFGPILKEKFCVTFAEVVSNFFQEFLDECTVICWWCLKVAHKQKNFSTTVLYLYKEKFAHVVSNSGKEYVFFTTSGRQDSSKFLNCLMDLQVHIPPDLHRII